MGDTDAREDGLIDEVDSLRGLIIELSDEGNHPWAPSTCECCGAEVEPRYGVDQLTCIECSRAGCWPGDEPACGKSTLSHYGGGSGAE